jgi:hypothetical protein
MRRVAVALIASVLLAAGGCRGSNGVVSPSKPPLPIASETSHYAFHVAAGDGVDAAWQETYHEWATARLGVQLGQRIGYFKYKSRQDMGDHTGNYYTNGYADVARLEIHTLWAIDNHEVVHLFMSTIGQSSALFSEGVAVAFQTDPANGDFRSSFNGEEVHAAARRYLASGQLVLPLGRIIETTGFRGVSDSTLSYQEAGSFVRFLIDRYGLDRFLAFWKSGVLPNDAADTIKPRFLTAMGVIFEDAEAAWLEMLRAA